MSTSPSGGPIRAAGGVVWRPSHGAPAPGASSAVEVVVVRRERYQDWSLPKGKVDPGERHRDAAVREVLEETGITVELGPKLATIRYETPLGTKAVRWWAMTPVESVPVVAPEDPEEIAEVRWVDFAEAWALVTYGTDRQVLGRFLSRVLTPE